MKYVYGFTILLALAVIVQMFFLVVGYCGPQGVGLHPIIAVPTVIAMFAAAWYAACRLGDN